MSGCHHSTMTWDIAVNKAAIKILSTCVWERAERFWCRSWSSLHLRVQSDAMMTKPETKSLVNLHLTSITKSGSCFTVPCGRMAQNSSIILIFALQECGVIYFGYLLHIYYYFTDKTSKSLPRIPVMFNFHYAIQLFSLVVDHLQWKFCPIHNTNFIFEKMVVFDI